MNGRLMLHDNMAAWACLPPRGIVSSMFSSFFSSGNKRVSKGSLGSEQQVLHWLFGLYHQDK